MQVKMYEYKELDHLCYSNIKTLSSKHVAVCEKNSDGYLNKPLCVLTNLYAEEGKRIKNLEVNEDDVWIASFPRSGTTWTQEMVWLVRNNLDYETSKIVPIKDRYSFLEFSTIDEKFKSRNTVDNTINLKSPRHIKTHLPASMLPEQVWQKKPKIVYVTRDPKDVVVSYYHHYRFFAGYEGKFEEFADCFLQDKVIWSPFWEHTLNFWKLRNEPNVLFLRYEDMKMNMIEVLKKVSKFFDKSYSEEQLTNLAEHLDFKNMQNDKSFDHRRCDSEEEPEKIAKDSSNKFMRKGQVGGWRDDMSQSLADRVDAWSRLKVLGTDYKLD